MKIIPKNIADRLRHLRELIYGPRGQSSFARAIGISPSRYHNYESALNEPPLDLLKKIASVAGCSIAWLVSGEGEPFLVSGLRQGAVRAVSEPTVEYEARPRQGIPIIAWASAADPESRIPMTKTGGVGEIPVPKDLHAVRVIGDSMSPLALNGQYLLCTNDPPSDGDVAVVEVIGQAGPLFKRVRIEGDTIYLLSVNPDPRHQTVRTLRRSEIRRIRRVWSVKL